MASFTGLDELQEQALLTASIVAFLTLVYHKGGKALAWLVTNHRWWVQSRCESPLACPIAFEAVPCSVGSEAPLPPIGPTQTHMRERTRIRHPCKRTHTRARA